MRWIGEYFSCLFITSDKYNLPSTICRRKVLHSRWFSVQGGNQTLGQQCVKNVMLSLAFLIEDIIAEVAEDYFATNAAQTKENSQRTWDTVPTHNVSAEVAANT